MIICFLQTGRLERQKISDEAEAEKSRRELLELQAHSAAVESTGQLILLYKGTTFIIMYTALPPT